MLVPITFQSKPHMARDLPRGLPFVCVADVLQLPLGVEDLIRILLDQLWEHFIGPIIFWPLQANHGLSIPTELSRSQGAPPSDSLQDSSSEDMEPLLSQRRGVHAMGGLLLWLSPSVSAMRACL